MLAAACLIYLESVCLLNEASLRQISTCTVCHLNGVSYCLVSIVPIYDYLQLAVVVSGPIQLMIVKIGQIPRLQILLIA